MTSKPGTPDSATVGTSGKRELRLPRMSTSSSGVNSCSTPTLMQEMRRAVLVRRVISRWSYDQYRSSEGRVALQLESAYTRPRSRRNYPIRTPRRRAMCAPSVSTAV